MRQEEQSMLTLTTETFSQVATEAEQLAAAHWDEVEAALHGAQCYRLDHERYASLERLGMPELTADGRYRLSVKRDERGLAYNAKARAVGIQALDRECMTLLLTEQGPAEGDGQDALCWGSGAGREGGRG